MVGDEHNLRRIRPCCKQFEERAALPQDHARCIANPKTKQRDRLLPLLAPPSPTSGLPARHEARVHVREFRHALSCEYQKAQAAVACVEIRLIRLEPAKDRLLIPFFDTQNAK